MEELELKNRRLSNKELGRMGENAGARYLRSRGYTILQRNWRCEAGEVDIVAQDENYLIFVEVKTRRSHELGYPAEAVTYERKKRYEKIASHYLHSFDLDFLPVRFDVLSIEVTHDNRAHIRHYIDAFGCGDM